jgi:ABC-type Fe3+ transport system permease subunit
VGTLITMLDIPPQCQTQNSASIYQQICANGDLTNTLLVVITILLGVLIVLIVILLIMQQPRRYETDDRPKPINNQKQDNSADESGAKEKSWIDRWLDR